MQTGVKQTFKEASERRTSVVDHGRKQHDDIATVTIGYVYSIYNFFPFNRIRIINCLMRLSFWLLYLFIDNVMVGIPPGAPVRRCPVPPLGQGFRYAFPANTLSSFFLSFFLRTHICIPGELVL